MTKVPDTPSDDDPTEVRDPAGDKRLVAKRDERTPGPGIDYGRPRRRGRWLKRLVLLVVVPVLMLVGASWWYAHTGRYVSTENAYVKSHVIAISTDLDGRISEVLIGNNERVSKGQVLFRLDPDAAWVELQLAQAKAETVRNDIAAMQAEFGQVQAEIEEALERVAFYARDARRQRDLANRGIASRSQLDEAEFELASAKQRVNGLRQKIRRVLADLGGDPARAVELHPRYLAAMSDVELAQLRLADTEVRAPADGVVTQVRMEPGEWVEEGEPVFGLIETAHTWVVANLKETQLTHVHEGQRVEVTIDAYPDTIWKATVRAIAPATGAEFAVLPPQNASGNWVKVVQRVPVHIDFDPNEGAPPLRSGMTAGITIDTERERRLFGAAREAIAALVHPKPEPGGESALMAK